MNSSNSTQTNIISSSLWGVARGLAVHTLIYPLEVVKIRLQCSQTTTTSTRVALDLLRQEGIQALYKGLVPQLLKTSVKQLWCWPIMTTCPPTLQRHGVQILQQQMLTGLLIATIDAAVLTPLEKAKMISAFRGGDKFSFKTMYERGWSGAVTHWGKLSVSWITFLTAQRYLRDYYSTQQQEKLSFAQLSQIGIQVAMIVSLVAAPLDIANTLKQVENRSFLSVLSERNFSRLYRGWPLQALSLMVHNIASVTLLDKLSR